MSAPALVDPPAMPTMVSRLPKFGSRPASGTPGGAAQTGPAGTAYSAGVTGSASPGGQLTNGSYHHTVSAAAAVVKAGLTGLPSPVKQNGLIRVPPALSMKWRKGGMEDRGVDGEIESQDRKGASVGQNHCSNYLQQHHFTSQQASLSATQRKIKKPITSSAGKGRGFGFGVRSPSPQTSPKTLPASKTGPRATKPSQTGSGLTNGMKQNLNGHSGVLQRMGTNGSLRLPLSSSAGRGGSRPGSRSGSPLNNPPASRSQSSDSLRSVGSGSASVRLSEDDRLRSRSLTQVQRLPSPTLTPPSTSSAAERGSKEAASSSPRALPRGPLARSPLAKHAPGGGGVGGAAEGEGGCFGGVKVQSSATLVRSGVTTPSLLPTSALKKPLLPSLSSTSKAGALSYKLSRPSLIKQPRPLRVTPARLPGSNQEVSQGPTGRRNSVETPPVTPTTTDDSPGSSPEAPETEGLTAEPVSQGELSVLGETLEDMSLSSTSSLDRNDTSQEYMDDFDNLGNGGVGILLLSSNNDREDLELDQSRARVDDDKTLGNGATKATGLHSFLADSMDWGAMRIGGDRGEYRLPRLSRRRKSSQPDYHDQGGSSLDLSPSDSCGSGGTYMWDEEGLEPLGGAATTTANSTTTHPIGSYDSDLNSIDILNNLESCELEDDDLMLDADLPEDTSLHNDGAGMSHMAQWRRRQLCWGTQDVHDNSGFQCYQLTEDPGNQRTDTASDKDLFLGLSPARSPCLSPGSGLGPGLDVDLGLGLGLDVEELAEDCCAVRAKLEHLQRLLLQEEEDDEELEDTLTTDTLSPDNVDTSHSSDEQRLHKQVEELLQEVQQLREEVRSRDRTIAQLTQELSVPMVPSRCRCQETETEGTTERHTQTSTAEAESLSLNHKASQTPWRVHTPQILHSACQTDQDRLTDLHPASSLTQNDVLRPAPSPASAPAPAEAPCPAPAPAPAPAPVSPLTPAPSPANAPEPPTASTVTSGVPKAGEQGEEDGNREREEKEETAVKGGESRDGGPGLENGGGTERKEGAGRSERRDSKERAGARGRSLQPSQPSKLRHLPPPTSRLAPCSGPALPQPAAHPPGVANAASSPLPSSAALAIPPRTRVLRQPSAPRDPESGAASGVKVRASPLVCGSSRLPKPKGH
ncbi:uncharacterized protein ACJ7VT_005403 [Polymixia lowei]